MLHFWRPRAVLLAALLVSAADANNPPEPDPTDLGGVDFRSKRQGLVPGFPAADGPPFSSCGSDVDDLAQRNRYLQNYPIEEKLKEKYSIQLPPMDGAPGQLYASYSDCSGSAANPKDEYSPSNGNVITLNLVIHVAYSGTPYFTAEQIREIVDNNNKHYAGNGWDRGDGTDTKIRWRIATEDEHGNAKEGIIFYNNADWFGADGSHTTHWNAFIQHASEDWDVRKFANVYVYGMTSYCGFAWYAKDAANYWYDGMSMNKNCMGLSSTTLAHEMGHYLNIIHTFGDYSTGQGQCHDDSECKERGDKICDTSAQDRHTSWIGYGCPTQIRCGTEDPIRNYMDYTGPDYCTDRFTEEQARRMRCTIASQRPGIVHSWGAASPPPPPIRPPLACGEVFVTEKTTGGHWCGKSHNSKDYSDDDKQTLIDLGDWGDDPNFKEGGDGWRLCLSNGEPVERYAKACAALGDCAEMSVAAKCAFFAKSECDGTKRKQDTMYRVEYGGDCIAAATAAPTAAPAAAPSTAPCTPSSWWESTDPGWCTKDVIGADYTADDGQTLVDLGFAKKTKLWKKTSSGWRLKGTTLADCRLACVALGGCKEISFDGKKSCYFAKQECTGPSRTSDDKWAFQQKSIVLEQTAAGWCSKDVTKADYTSDDGKTLVQLGFAKKTKNWKLTGDGWRLSGTDLASCKVACVALGGCKEISFDGKKSCYFAKRECTGSLRTSDTKYLVTTQKCAAQLDCETVCSAARRLGEEDSQRQLYRNLLFGTLPADGQVVPKNLSIPKVIHDTIHDGGHSGVTAEDLERCQCT